MMCSRVQLTIQKTGPPSFENRMVLQEIPLSCLTLPAP